MDAKLLTALVRWLLFASVALGVVVMHHAVIDEAPTGTVVHSMDISPMPGQPEPDPGHEMRHLCMAIIQQPGSVVSILLLLLVGVVALVPLGQSGPVVLARRPPARPPPGLAGRSLLHMVCVARL